MKKQSEKRDSNPRSRRDKRSYREPMEWTIRFAPPPLPGLLGFNFGSESNEERDSDQRRIGSYSSAGRSKSIGTGRVGSRHGASDFDFRIQQVPQNRGIAAHHFGVDVSAIHEKLQVNVFQSDVRNEVGAAYNGAKSHSSTIQFSTDQLPESGGHRVRRRAVVEERNGLAQDLRAKAVSRLSNHQDTIAGNQIGVHDRLNVDRDIAILYEEIDIAFPVVSDRRLESNGQSLRRLCVGEGVNSGQRCKRGGRHCAGTCRAPQGKGNAEDGANDDMTLRRKTRGKGTGRARRPCEIYRLDRRILNSRLKHNITLCAANPSPTINRPQSIRLDSRVARIKNSLGKLFIWLDMVDYGHL